MKVLANRATVHRGSNPKASYLYCCEYVSSLVTSKACLEFLTTLANDRDLKKRIRKVPGVPIMSVAKGKYVIERLPGAPAT